MTDANAGGEGDHYSALNKSAYDSAMFYAEGPYRQWQQDHAIAALQLGREASAAAEGDKTGWGKGSELCDLGGGNGMFAAEMARSVGMAPGSVTVVEPSAEMLAGVKDLPPADAAMIGDSICSGLEEWAALGHLTTQEYEDEEEEQAAPPRFARAMLKEVVHHMSTSPAERIAAWKDLRERRMTDDGVLLIIARPQTDIDYPMFDAARKVWASRQPAEQDLAAELKEAGFPYATCTRQDYDCSISLGEWIGLVRQRFWSTFSAFDDAELEAGCAEIRAGRADDVQLHFQDRLVFIVASNSEAATSEGGGSSSGDGQVAAAAAEAKA